MNTFLARILILSICFLLSISKSLLAAPPLQVLAYLTTDRESPPAFQARYSYFNQVGFDFFKSRPNGVIYGNAPAANLAFAQAQKMQTFPTVTNYAGKDFNGDLAHAIITSPAATNTFIESALKIIDAGHFSGLNLDFESIKADDRAAFTTFVQTLAEKIHQAGHLLVISVPATDKDDPTNSWTGAFDFKALSVSADVVQVMTYDQNGPWGPAGPIAGLGWVEGAIRYMASVMPPSKISLGIPAFGYDWDLDEKNKNSEVHWNNVDALIARVHADTHWDDASSSPNITYTARGHRHIAWYENAKSLGLKTALVAKYKLGGIFIWCLGQEDDAFWQALQVNP